MSNQSNSRINLWRPLLVLVVAFAMLLGIFLATMFQQNEVLDYEYLLFALPRIVLISIATSVLSLSVNRNGVAIHCSFAVLVGFLLSYAYVTVSLPSACGGQQACFDAIQLGDLSDDVVAALGVPDEIRPCSDTLYWGGDHHRIGPNDGRCTEEYYYYSMPGGWSVGLSDDSKVVAKYTYVSP